MHPPTAAKFYSGLVIVKQYVHISINMTLTRYLRTSELRSVKNTFFGRGLIKGEVEKIKIKKDKGC